MYSVKDTLNKRNNNVEFDFFKDKAKKINFITDIRNIGMEFDKKLTPQILDLTIDKSIHKIKIGDFFQGGILINQYTLDKTNFIATKSIDINYLSNIYTNIFNLGKDEILDNYLKNFDDNIKSVRLINSVSNIPTFKVKLNNKVEPVLLNSLGDGINRFMAIICAIWSSKDGFLFIDEVENGIHYTNLEKLWKIIFEVSKDANCQVFATTHSKECIEAFNRENEEDNGTFIELYKNKKDEIVAKTRDYEQLDYSLTHGGSFRGE